MRTELKKSFEYGFVLTDQELQRIHGELVQRMSKVSTTFTTTYELKFENEVVAQRSSLQEVLSESNGGVWMIRALTIIVTDQSQGKDPLQISLTFQAKKSDSISYAILGDDQDWVYLTGIKLEEGIEAVKKLPIAKMIADIETIAGPYYVSATASIVAHIVAFFSVPDYNFCWGRYVKVYERRRSRANFIVFGLIVAVVLGVIIAVLGNYISALLGIGSGH
jgi:hypothetical protein